jgi:hypothetical protein
VAELTECRRSEGVLTIKIRFRNTSDKPGHLTFTSWNASALDNPKFYARRVIAIVGLTSAIHGVLQSRMGPRPAFSCNSKMPQLKSRAGRNALERLIEHPEIEPVSSPAIGVDQFDVGVRVGSVAADTDQDAGVIRPGCHDS